MAQSHKPWFCSHQEIKRTNHIFLAFRKMSQSNGLHAFSLFNRNETKCRPPLQNYFTYEGFIITRIRWLWSFNRCMRSYKFTEQVISSSRRRHVIVVVRSIATNAIQTYSHKRIYTKNYAQSSGIHRSMRIGTFRRSHPIAPSSCANRKRIRVQHGSALRSTRQLKYAPNHSLRGAVPNSLN